MTSVARVWPETDEAEWEDVLDGTTDRDRADALTWTTWLQDLLRH